MSVPISSGRPQDQGFTLVELLVVMIVIGVLAAVAIPTFLNQRNKGYDSQAKSDARSIQTEAETYYTDAQAYPANIVVVTPASPAPSTPAADTIYVKQSASSTVTTTVTLNSAKTKFCAQVTSKSGTVFKVSSAAAGVATGACAPADVA